MVLTVLSCKTPIISPQGKDQNCFGILGTDWFSTERQDNIRSRQHKVGREGMCVSTRSPPQQIPRSGCTPVIQYLSQKPIPLIPIRLQEDGRVSLVCHKRQQRCKDFPPVCTNSSSNVPKLCQCTWLSHSRVGPCPIPKDANIICPANQGPHVPNSFRQEIAVDLSAEMRC
jgi:hypothetical protein